MLRTYFDVLAHKVSDVLKHPVSWSLSFIAGLICYYFSPSFKDQLAKKKPLRMVASIVAFLCLPVSWLWTKYKRSNGSSNGSPYISMIVCCTVFVTTCVYSHYEEEIEEEGKGTGAKIWLDLLSYVGFSLGAFGISRNFDVGFEVGMFSFFLQSAMTTALNMNRTFITICTGVFCCFLMGIRIYLEHPLDPQLPVTVRTAAFNLLRFLGLHQVHRELPPSNLVDSHAPLHVDEEPPASSLPVYSNTPHHVDEELPASNPVHSNTPHEKIYDVFVSFEYDETVSVFINHLLSALSSKNIKTFPDFETRREEEQMQTKPAFLSSLIEACKISLVILTKDYASSQWRLDELEKIMECRSKYGQIVLPIYHHIDQESLRDTYGDVFSKADELFGWTWKMWSYLELPKLLADITEDVLQKLDPAPQAAVYPDVYVSFCYKDLSVAYFARNLYTFLHEDRIRVSEVNVNPDKVRTGETLSEYRSRALETSKISLIILSKGYAKSQRCLDELLKAMECHARNTQIVIPIFYDVPPAELVKPEVAFENIEKEKVDMLKRALSEIIDLPVTYNFSHLDKIGDEEAEKITDYVLRILNRNDREVGSTDDGIFVFDEESNPASGEETSHMRSLT